MCHNSSQMALPAYNSSASRSRSLRVITSNRLASTPSLHTNRFSTAVGPRVSYAVSSEVQASTRVRKTCGGRRTDLVMDASAPRRWMTPIRASAPHYGFLPCYSRSSKHQGAYFPLESLAMEGGNFGAQRARNLQVRTFSSGGYASRARNLLAAIALLAAIDSNPKRRETLDSVRDETLESGASVQQVARKPKSNDKRNDRREGARRYGESSSQ